KLREAAEVALQSYCAAVVAQQAQRCIYPYRRGRTSNTAQLNGGRGGQAEVGRQFRGKDCTIRSGVHQKIDFLPAAALGLHPYAHRRTQGSSGIRKPTTI